MMMIIMKTQLDAFVAPKRRQSIVGIRIAFNRSTARSMGIPRTSAAAPNSIRLPGRSINYVTALRSHHDRWTTGSSLRDAKCFLAANTYSHKLSSPLRAVRTISDEMQSSRVSNQVNQRLSTPTSSFSGSPIKSDYDRPRFQVSRR